VPVVLLERSWGARFTGIQFVWFGFKLGKILNFKWFFSLKIQINRPKTPCFEKKNQLKMWSHLKVYHLIQVWGMGMCLWYFWKDLNCKGFNGIYFVSFGHRIREISNFKWFLSLQIQINHKNQILKGNSIEMWSHWQVIFNSSKIGYRV